MQDAIIEAECSVFDYGCGRGQDVERLRRMGFEALGWDPHFRPGEPLIESDVVLVSYVLNVIEDPAERRAALAKAWALAKEVMSVSVRLIWEAGAVAGEELGDGVRTSRDTFQHLFTPREIRELVEEVTGTRCVSPVPGVVYAFRRDERRFTHLARETIGRFDWKGGEDFASDVGALVAFTEKRGRPPLFEELPMDLVPRLGALTRREIQRIVNQGSSAERVAEGAKRSTLDTLLYLGTSIFSGRPRLADLPIGVQADIKIFFGSYREACARADRLLSKIADDRYIRGAMQNSPGKLTATALYVHRNATHSLATVLKLYEYCGFVAAGRPDGWNILKLDHRGRRVSWSSYPTFESDPHPPLEWTYGVEMSSLESSYQYFGNRSNRPILHRKEEFIDNDDPNAGKYRRLTVAEVRAGLYQNPTRIGLEDGWKAELERCGVELRGHRLVTRGANRQQRR